MGFYSDSEPVSEPSFWFENELDVPLIPAALLDQHEKFHSTHLGTLREPNPESDYMFRPSLKFLSRAVPDHYVLSFWGHGANSYSSNFRLAYGDVAVLFQIGFGVYTDPESSQKSWNEAVAGIDAFLSDIITSPTGEPRTRDTIVAFSDFRDFEAGGSGPTLYARGEDNQWDPSTTYRSWGEFQKEHSSE
jgi:hypothetical protein